MALEGNNDGTDVFWPGYVDAVTNLVLNLLFLLTIMTVAVFMFALELGRQHKTTEAPATQSAESPVSASSPATEVAELRKQLEQLKREAQQANELNVPQKVVEASSEVPQPQKSVERSNASGGAIVVKFADAAVMLTDAESEKLRKTLAPVVASGGARIDVLVPKGFSEARRLGFYRAMAVRNLLIDMKVPAARIEVSVREGAISSDASQVRVMAR